MKFLVKLGVNCLGHQIFQAILEAAKETAVTAEGGGSGWKVFNTMSGFQGTFNLEGHLVIEPSHAGLELRHLSCASPQSAPGHDGCTVKLLPLDLHAWVRNGDSVELEVNFELEGERHTGQADPLPDLKALLEKLPAKLAQIVSFEPDQMKP